MKTDHATFLSGYFKMDSLKFYNQKMWGDMFGPGYFEFDSSVSFHRTGMCREQYDRS